MPLAMQLHVNDLRLVEYINIVRICTIDVRNSTINYDFGARNLLYKIKPVIVITPIILKTSQRTPG